MQEDLIPDPSPINPDEEAAAVYPVPDDQHIGVSTDEGTDPNSIDQGDEEIRREQSGIPD